MGRYRTKLTKQEAKNFRVYSGTLTLIGGAVHIGKFGPSKFRNVLTGSLVITAAATMLAYWNKKTNLVTDWTVPDLVREW